MHLSLLGIVKMATEADWLKLKLSDLKAALLGAGGDASGLRSKQSYAQALVALGVALPGGGGPQLLGGGAGGGGVGAVDVRSAKEQLAGCVADAELEKGLVGVLPSAFDASLPADVLGWLVASLFVVLGGPLTRSRLENGWKVDFTGPDGVRKRMLAVCMEKKSPDFVPMVEQAVAEYIRVHWALPVGVCAGDAEAAMMMVLDYLRRVEDKAGGLAQQIGGLLSSAKSTGSLAAKLSAQEWSRAAAKLQRLGYMVEKFDAPLFSQMGHARSALTNKEKDSSGKEVVKPLLPTDPQLSPDRLRCCVDRGGNMVEDETQQWRVDEEGRQVLVTVPHGPTRKKAKTLYEVAHGYIMYFVMLLVGSCLFEGADLSSEYAVCEPGVWLHPMFVIKFSGLMRRIVGQDVISAAGLDDILRPLLRQVTEYVNHPETVSGRWCGDTAIIYVCEKTVEHVGLVTARVSVDVIGTRGEESGPRNVKQKKTVAVKTTPPKTDKKCLTCDGFASHESGRCSRCRYKDRQKQQAAGGQGARKERAAGVDRDKDAARPGE